MATDSKIIAFKVSPGESIHVRMPRRKHRRFLSRLLQFVTGIHRVHHVRWSYGWKVPLLPFVRFDAQTYKDHWRGDRPTTRPAHWERVERRHYHDCTKTGTY